MLAITEYEIGRSYKVRCVRAQVCGRRTIWPVMGPWHEDKEFIGFNDHHFHIDPRFLSDGDFEFLALKSHGILGVVVTDIEETRGYYRRSAYPVVDLGLRIRRCRRPMLEYPRARAHWIRSLEAAFESAEVRESLICPHRGAPLQGLPVREGCVTCPLHGLRWDCETGRLRKSQ